MLGDAELCRRQIHSLARPSATSVNSSREPSGTDAGPVSRCASSSPWSTPRPTGVRVGDSRKAEPRRDVHRRRRRGRCAVGYPERRSPERRPALRRAPRGDRRDRRTAAVRGRRVARGEYAAATPLPPPVPRGAARAAGRGHLGGALMAPILERCDRDGVRPTWRPRATATARCMSATASSPAVPSRCPAAPRSGACGAIR